MNKSEFALYPEERHWWSFADYRAVLETMRERRPVRVLEFGPGSSTLALLEGGATTIDTCEDNPDWAEVYEDRLQGKYPAIVRVHRYTYGAPLTIPAIDGQTYDLALIDGPHGTNSRPLVVRYCMARCAAVLTPTEDGNPDFRKALHVIAAVSGWTLTIRETGPLSGGFALLTPPEPVDAEHEEQPETAAVDPSTLDTPEDPAPLANTMVPPSTLTNRRSRGRRKGR